MEKFHAAANVVDIYKEKKKVTAEMLKQASDENLISLRMAVNEDLSEINSQLSEAKINAAISRNYSDPVWFRKISEARRLKGLLIQRIQTELSARKSKRKEEHGHTHEDSVITAMKRLLTKETVDRILETAKEIRLDWEAEEKSKQSFNS